MRKEQKEQVVQDLKQLFEGNELMVVAHNEGLTVAEITELRAKLREAGAGMKVTKNTLAKIAAKGTKFESISDILSGPTTIAYSNDPVAAAKVVVNFAKDNEKLVVVGGANLEGGLDLDAVTAISLLPSLDEARAMIVGMISTPASRIARCLSARSEQEAA
ncbi:MAG: 50S ribosomal protein L10 [Alphaproteobacteria bacterium]|nr:50S ribosomal protein L10 [Alphaproteobacteria bacterium]MCV6599678.1 50S ribosomal protein L10 [Alphaproteobacteria bacterium]